MPAGITVSLTTTSRRIDAVSRVVETLLTQTVRPARTVLWLSEEPYLLDEGVGAVEVPAELRALEAHGLLLRWTPNTGPYRKLLPALEAWGGTVVTADDDTLYPPDWLQTLLAMHAETPATICAFRGHRMCVGTDGTFTSYWRWPAWVGNDPAHDCFPTGKDGVFFPAGSLHPDVLDTQQAARLAPTCDDVWFKLMALRAGTPARCVSGHRDFPLVGFAANLGGLYAKYNLFGNDESIAASFTAFDVSPSRVLQPAKGPLRRTCADDALAQLAP